MLSGTRRRKGRLLRRGGKVGVNTVLICVSEGGKTEAEMVKNTAGG